VDTQPPAQLVWGLINAHTLARCMHMVAEFGVADALGDAPATAAELAARTGMNGDALQRMLRLLAAHGVFANEVDGFVHTPASELLRSGHPQSMRAFARMIGLPAIWNGFTEMRQVAVTGKPASDWSALLAYFAQHPEEASLFNQAMVDKANAVIPAVTGTYDFSDFRVIADIGGGRGHLLQAILAQSPAASGVLFELPHVIADASAMASPRLQLVAGDFFADAMPAADLYVLMEVLHDWDDADAIRILTAIRRTAPAHARLLVAETLIGEAPGPQQGKMLDIIMLAVTGGRERTPGEYAVLLAQAGWKMQRAIATPSPLSLVEATVT
jgi:hypothetical protein